MLLAPPAFESCIQHPGTAFQAELRWKKAEDTMKTNEFLSKFFEHERRFAFKKALRNHVQIYQGKSPLRW